MSPGEGRGASIPSHSGLGATAVIVVDRLSWEHGDGPQWGVGERWQEGQPHLWVASLGHFRNHLLHLKYLRTPRLPANFPPVLVFSLPSIRCLLPPRSYPLSSPKNLHLPSQLSHTPSSPSTETSYCFSVVIFTTQVCSQMECPVPKRLAHTMLNKSRKLFGYGTDSL